MTPLSAPSSVHALTAASGITPVPASTPALSRRRFCRIFAATGAGALLGASSLGAVGCSRTSTDAPEFLSTTFFAFDTAVTLKAACAQATLDAAVERCRYFESIFSRTIPTSDIGRLNDAHGAPVEVAPETADIITHSFAFSRASDGLFDISIGAVSTLWDFHEGVRPSDADIAAAIPHIDWTKIHVEGAGSTGSGAPTVTLADPDMKLDLGGIAKGYIADDLARLFSDAGCESALINLGGNVLALGVKPDGSAWKVGIRDPNGSAQSIIGSVTANGRTGVVTSGLYERSFVEDGVTYHHILDPRTGFPVETDLSAATVICESSTDGDAFATVLFLLGHDRALAFLDAREDLCGLVIDRDGTITLSEGAPIDLI